MIINIETSPFRESLSKILTVIDRKNSRPILSYTLITIENNEMYLSATDLEVSTQLTIPCKCEENFSFCVNAKNIFDIVRELPDGVITLRKTDNNLEISMEDIHYSLLIFEHTDFPKLLFFQNDPQIKLERKIISTLINKTQHAISNDETRIYLNGVYVQEIDSKLRFVSTDGHRLALFESEVESTGLDQFKNGFIIPKKGIYELKRMVDATESDEIAISVDDSFLYLFNGDNHYLTIRLISRDYPKYQAVIPSKTIYKVKTDSTNFYDAVKRIKIMSNEKSNGIKISLKNDEMTILANNPSLGDAAERIPINYDGEFLDIGFNAKYLLDSLNVIEDNEVILELNNELSPIIIKSPNHPDYLGIIMPLKIQ